MKWLWLALLVLLGNVSAAAPASPGNRYAEGQIWEYKTRPQDKGSLLKIQRTEDGGTLGTIYHISIVNITLSDGTTTDLPHAPVSRATLDASVVKLSKVSRDWPDVTDGIAEWRANKGGVFTIPVAAIADMIEKAISQQRAAAT